MTLNLEAFRAPSFGVTELHHQRFLRALERCETPGTRSWRRIRWAVACIMGEREWWVPWQAAGAKNRTKLDSYRLMVAAFANDGGEFTYLRAMSWLADNDKRYCLSRDGVAGYLRVHQRELGIRAVHRFDRHGKDRQGPTVWRVGR